jgi:carboxymethylenebutenolidase
MNKKSFLVVSISLILIVVLILVQQDNTSSPTDIDNTTGSTSNQLDEETLTGDNTSLEEVLGVTDSPAVQTQLVSYGDYQGYLARPAGTGDYPGIVLIHERRGLNDNIQKMARLIADQGYQVLAVDLYNGEVATTPDRARELSRGLDQQIANQHLIAAVQYLRQEQNASQVGSRGRCFGGGQSLQLALTDADLEAAVIYYGSLETGADILSSIQAPVLGIFGTEDQVVPLQQVRDFESILNQLNIQNDIFVYEGVGHAFANPSNDGFAPEQTRDARDKTLEFLQQTLQ